MNRHAVGASRAAVSLVILVLAACGGGGGGPSAAPPTISSFAATPLAIIAGSSSTLAWTVSGATSLKIDQGVGNVAGTSVAVTPQTTTTYTLTATNRGMSVTATATVRVGSAPVIATASLPDGTVGTTYAQTLLATGGILPYLWVAGSLPPGLSLRQDGTLSGTPTAAGTFALSLSVIDRALSPQAADASLQLVIH